MDVDGFDVEVAAAGGRVFGEIVPDGKVAIGFNMGARGIDGSALHVCRVEGDPDQIRRLLARLSHEVENELAKRAAHVRHQAARGPLTVDAAHQLLTEGGFPPGTLFRRPQ